MNVLDACNYLLENSDGGLFVKTLVLHDVIEQLPAGAVLHDQVELRLGFDNQQLAQAYLVQLDHVGVPDLLQNFDFPGDSLNVFFFLYASLLEYFYRDLLSHMRLLVPASVGVWPSLLCQRCLGPGFCRTRKAPAPCPPHACPQSQPNPLLRCRFTCPLFKLSFNR